MKRKYRPSFALFLVLFLCVSLLGGCSWTQSSQDDGITLWVVTEQSSSDGMNLQAEMIAERMEEAYDNLTIQLDILPTDSQERETTLRQLRNQIMAGKGPDVYLLPTSGSLITDYSSRAANLAKEKKNDQIVPLFSDVNQVMRSRIFADIQPYYRADSELKKESLNTQVMDAGTLDGARYVLPLRFTMPVLLTAPADWAENGLNPELLNSSVTMLVNTALARGDTAMLTGILLPDDLSLLSKQFDYENAEMLLTAGEIADYMRLYQAWSAVTVESTQSLLKKWDDKDLSLLQAITPTLTEQQLRDLFPFEYDINDFNSIFDYICSDMYWRTAGLPLFTSQLSNTLETSAIAKHAEFETAMYPLRAADGSVVASVTYFGAVGCSSKDPALAYEFLRQFLTEEFQWDIYRPRAEHTNSWWDITPEVQSAGQIEDSWPVLTTGSVPYLWSSLKYQNIHTWTSTREISRQISRQLQKIDLTDSDLPALNWEIDEVRFPVILDGEESIEYALSLLNGEDGTPTDVDIDKLAQQVYQALWFHLMEG